MCSSIEISNILDSVSSPKPLLMVNNVFVAPHYMVNAVKEVSGKHHAPVSDCWLVGLKEAVKTKWEISFEIVQGNFLGYR